MPTVPRSGFELLKSAVSDFMDDECPRMAAALSYYTVFSLPPLLVLLILIAGTVLDPSDVRGALEAQLGCPLAAGMGVPPLVASGGAHR